MAGEELSGVGQTLTPLCSGEILDDPGQQLGSSAAFVKGRQQARTVGGDDEPASGPAPRPHLQPGETAELLGAVEEEDVGGSKAAEQRRPLRC